MYVCIYVCMYVYIYIYIYILGVVVTPVLFHEMRLPSGARGLNFPESQAGNWPHSTAGHARPRGPCTAPRGRGGPMMIESLLT